MSNRLINVFLLFAVLVFTVGLAISQIPAGSGPSSQERAALQGGERIPDFERSLGLEANGVRGPVLVLFLSSQCPWCQASAPTWKRMVDTLREKTSQSKVVVLTVPDDQEEDAKAFLRRNKMQDVLLHTVEDRPAFRDRWVFEAVPYSVLLDSNGQVLWAHRGNMTLVATEGFERALQRITARGPSSSKQLRCVTQGAVERGSVEAGCGLPV